MIRVAAIFGLFIASLASEASGPADLDSVVAEVEALLDAAQHNPGERVAAHAAAETLIDSTIPLAIKTGDSEVHAELLRLEWLIRLQADRLDGSEIILREALDVLGPEGGDPALRAHINTNLAYTLVLGGDFSAALRYLRGNVALSLEAGDESMLANDLYIIGDAYLKMGELGLAKRYFEESIAPFEHERGRVYFENVTKLATIQRREGDPGGALTTHKAVLAFFRQAGAYRAIPAGIEVARDYMALGQGELAVPFAVEAFDDPRAFTEQRIDAALVLLELARIDGSEDDFGHWYAVLDGLLDDDEGGEGRAYSHPVRRLAFAQITIDHHAARGDLASAERSARRGVDVYQHVLRGLEGSYDSQLAWASAAEPFVSSYIAILLNHAPDQVLDVLEQLSVDGHFAARTDGTSQAAEFFDDAVRLEAYLAAEKALVDASASASGDVTARGAVIAAARLSRDLARERYLVQGGAGDRPQTAMVATTHAPGEIDIPEGDLVLRYYVSKKASLVVIRDRHSESVMALPSIEQVKRLVDSARGQMNVAGADPWSGSLADLSAVLPIELIHSGRYRRIILVTGDVMHGVPFSAINVNPDIRPYRALAELAPVLRAPSMRTYYGSVSHPMENPPGDDVRIVIFADPQFDPASADNSSRVAFRNWSASLERLPYTAREAEAISAVYPEDSIATYLGRDATSDVLLAEGARQADVLHIATHGYFNAETPDIVGIATSSIDINGDRQRGFLSITELLKQRYETNLVVISGCETMLGRQYAGAGVRSLATGMMSQGAGAVMATLWKIPDRATAEFMRVFYVSLLRRDGDAALALNDAQLELIRSEEWYDPSIWAAFALTSTHHAVDRNVFQ
ncbi:CHAT domain-containing protein [Marinihelvus fidelis]|uniref:CHAT domain-containing protein n=1 Tax=Marinihelvus fidelis TaxID=2613842 RepID=A0A5N0TJ26_9GAMM|nr:CHAT domain-containing protein [Marinihelvus fidelis]KAA9134107.1 CHAT domain-containing protein [Marinihelvus fidelis]